MACGASTRENSVRLSPLGIECYRIADALSESDGQTSPFSIQLQPAIACFRIGPISPATEYMLDYLWKMSAYFVFHLLVTRRIDHGAH